MPWLELHSAVLLFGLAGLFGKGLDLPPLAIVFGRTAFASVAFLVLLAAVPALRPRRDSIRARGAGELVLAGALLAAHWFTFFQSIQLSTVALGLLTFSSYPLFVTVLEPLCFGERLRARDLLTALGVIAGLALVVPSVSFHDRLAAGALWGILSGLTFALLSLVNRRLVGQHPPLVVAAGENVVAACLLLPLAVGTLSRPAPRELLLLAVLGVVCTALAHFLFLSSLAHIRAQVVSVVTGLEAVYGTLFALLWFREVPSLRTIAGGIVLLGVVTLAQWLRPKDEERGATDEGVALKEGDTA